MTDGTTGCGHRSLQKCLETWDQRDPSNPEEKFPLPFNFNCKLHIMVIGNPNDPDVKNSLPLFERLIEINGQGGEVFVPDGPLSLKTVQSMFQRMAENYYMPYYGVLKCGNFRNNIQLYPAPEIYIR